MLIDKNAPQGVEGVCTLCAGKLESDHQGTCNDTVVYVSTVLVDIAHVLRAR